jgi:hypothetical protein
MRVSALNIDVLVQPLQPHEVIIKLRYCSGETGPHNSVGNTSASYSEGVGFRSRPRLFSDRGFSWVFFSHAWEGFGEYLKLGHYNVFLRPLYFLIC